jgi:hypothetical protein
MQLETECRLPCWWSITPGLSKADEVKMALESYGFLWGDDDTARLRAGSIILALQFEFEKDVVQAIHVRSEDMSAFSSDSQPRFPEFWQPYGPAPVVNHYGRPSRVFVYHPFQFDAGGGPTVHLVLDYEEQGITIEYLGSAEYLGDNRYRTCATIETVGSIGLHLRQSGTANDVIEQLIPPDSVSHIAEPEKVYDRISWQSATGTDLESFYDLLQRSGEAPCFEFSSN